MDWAAMTTTGYLLSVCACFRSFQNEIKLHMHTQTDRYTDTDIYGIDVYKQCSHALHTIGIIAVWLQYTQKRIHIYALCSTVVDGTHAQCVPSRWSFLRSQQTMEFM